MRVALDDVDMSFPIHRARVLPGRVDLLSVDFLIGAAQNQLPVAIEHHHRLWATVENVDVILLIDGHAGDARLIGGPTRGRLRPSCSRAPARAPRGGSFKPK